MKSVTQVGIDWIKDCIMFDVGPNWDECPYCSDMFKSKFNYSTKRWQVHCSRSCYKMAMAERKELR